MADTMRWRYGDTNPVVAAVDGKTVIEIGDQLWLDEHKARPASELMQGVDVDSRAYFRDRFLGVAMQRSRDGDKTPVRVATTGVFEFALDHGTSGWELGDWITLEFSTDGLRNQNVERTCVSSRAIGRIAKRSEGTATSVLVAICSTVMTGGIR